MNTVQSGKIYPKLYVQLFPDHNFINSTLKSIIYCMSNYSLTITVLSHHYSIVLSILDIVIQLVLLVAVNSYHYLVLECMNISQT